MAERRSPLLLLFVASLGSATADARKPDTSEMEPERDQLLDKITRGVDFDASVKRFGELIRERDAIVATSRKAVDDERAASKAKRDWLETYRQTADHETAWRCTMTPDPAHPLPSTESRFKADWGKVVRREITHLQPKNALDAGESVTMYEVAGLAGHYVFEGKHFDFSHHPFEAALGDLVLVCHGGETSDKDLPTGWGDRHVRSGFGARLSKPPLIVEKARYQPIHLTSNSFFWAIRDAKWKWPGLNVLSNVEVGRDLGGGRWEIVVEQGLSWVLEVPPSTKKKEILVPGHLVWVIAGDQRFDSTLHKLVLVARDLEPTYVIER